MIQYDSRSKLPELRSVWQHHNGNEYIVEEISNRESERQDKYPTTVIYRNVRNGNLYSRPFERWYPSMTLVKAALPTGDQIDVELEAASISSGLNHFSDGNKITVPVMAAALIARGAALKAANEVRLCASLNTARCRLVSTPLRKPRLPSSKKGTGSRALAAAGARPRLNTSLYREK